MLPVWGHKRLGELRITEVDRGLASLAGRGLSRDTVRLAKTMLGKLYKEAIREELVATNPVSNCRMPAVTKTSDRRAMSVEEMEALVSSTVGSRIHGPVVIGLTTGLRPGEILSLRWEDLDLESIDPTLVVRESKTAAGRRTVVLTSYAVEVLKGQRAFNIRNARAAESNGSMWADDGFVFPSITGTRWDISNFRNVFQKPVEMPASVTGDRTSFATAQHHGCSPTTCTSRSSPIRWVTPRSAPRQTSTVI
ncbi:MAG: tyrosine-type recombinase/integrase [Actinobacteria bacterium]|uniref:Unannotated protein n=1 Tax=freshwater metagenome TaxID=449393 RepID=A0A6J7J2A2_9ZZZZ|nr:tyrosine-type recombinase/integrase [Actinomycetota bacterium]